MQGPIPRATQQQQLLLDAGSWSSSTHGVGAPKRRADVIRPRSPLHRKGGLEPAAANFGSHSPDQGPPLAATAAPRPPPTAAATTVAVAGGGELRLRWLLTGAGKEFGKERSKESLNLAEVSSNLPSTCFDFLEGISD